MASEEPRTVIVERSGGSGMTGIIAIIALIIVAVGGYMLIESNNDKNSAVSTAAQQVGDAAEKAGDAVQGATKK